MTPPPPPFTFTSDQTIRHGQLATKNQLLIERNRAYLLVILLLICVGALACAVTVLANIHTVVPVVSVVDSNGHVIKQEVIQKDSLTAQDSLIQGKIHDFITHCNTFDSAWRQRYADLCRLHSSTAVAEQYDRETAPENTSNPYYVIGQNGRRYPKITSISALEKDAYRVSFQLITEKPGAAPSVEFYTALVRFTFTLKPLALGDRWENALGFAALSYRKDQELSAQ